MKSFLKIFLALLMLDCFCETIMEKSWGKLTPQTQNGVLTVVSTGMKRNVKSLPVDRKLIAGHHLVCTVEVKAELSKPLKHWKGTSFFVAWRESNGKYGYQPCLIGGGHFDWKNATLNVSLPADANKIFFSFGTEGSEGKVFFRNFKIVSDGYLLDMRKIDNMGFIDKVAGDGKGGWSDQGNAQDASKFPLRQSVFGGVHFWILNPAQNDQKSMLVMSSTRFPNGPKLVTVDFPLHKKARYLYLLHCDAWEKKSEKTIGSIKITGNKGSVTLPVGHEDIVSSYRSASRKNCWMGATWTSSNGTLGIGVARFALPENIGNVQSITFIGRPEQPGMWMIVAATLSDRKIEPVKVEPFVLKASKDWRPLPQDVIQNPKPGTALDISGLFDQPPAGTMGRVIVNKDGHFAFEKAPDKPVRFMVAGLSYRTFQKAWGKIPGELTDKEHIDAYTASLKRGGYNAVRLWANALRPGKRLKAGEFDAEAYDRIQYFIASLKKQGIYVFFTAKLPMVRFDNGTNWNDKRESQVRWYNNPYDLEAWKKWMRRLLTDVNPYTKTRMADDPVFAMIDTNNEQEFMFLSQNLRSRKSLNVFLPVWKDYLKKRYGTDAKWKAAWGKDAAKLNSIDDIQDFTALSETSAGPRWNDTADFILEKEKGLMDAQRNALREIGFKGPVCGFLMGRSIRYSEVRRDNDFVSANGYVSHPFGPGTYYDGQSVAQVSSSELAANHIRSFLAIRLAGKPFLLSEHGHVYFNQYRYEQGFIIGGYAALNDWDALSSFCQPMALYPNSPIYFFDNRFDTVIRASELITALLFRRGDAATSKVRCAVVYDYETSRKAGTVDNAVNSEQLKLGLVCRVDTVSLDRVKSLPKGTHIYQEAESTATLVRYADSNVAESSRNSFDLKKAFREIGVADIPGQNPDCDQFVSSTKEIVLDGQRKFLSINTPRLQGICSRDRKGADLTDFAIRYSGSDSCIALASIDGLKPLKQAKRMLLIISGNVLNNGITWESKDMVKRLKGGTTPLLLHTGKYTVELKVPGQYICYALAADGTRVAEIPGEKTAAGTLWKIDTSAPARSSGVYFEIIRQ